MEQLPPRADFGRIVALTGAGISVAAGLGTFRGPDGEWTLHPDVERAMHAEHVPGNVDLMWSFWGGMYAAAQAAGPTPAHRALAAAGATVVTQNVDGLHHAAGSVDAIEIHGSGGRARCLLCPWAGPAAAAVRAVDDPRPRCPVCGELVRPAVVLFGESLDEAALAAAQRAAVSADLFLAVGTSGRVAPASWLAPMARAAGALVINIDPVPGDPGPGFDRQVTGDAQQVLAEWLQ